MRHGHTTGFSKIRPFKQSLPYLCIHHTYHCFLRRCLVSKYLPSYPRRKELDQLRSALLSCVNVGVVEHSSLDGHYSFGVAANNNHLLIKHLLMNALSYRVQY